MSEQYLLEMVGISKSFPGVKALDNVQLKVRPGTVHSLMGENGAGKSTLMKCLFGIYLEDEGEIRLNGEKVHFHNPKEALENGVSMVHQELNQVLKRSVAENMMLGRFPTRMGFVDHKAMHDFTQKIFDDVKIKIDPRTRMEKLSVSQRQMVEIAKAVSYDAKVLILDEPTSSLTEQEVSVLFGILNLLRDRGMGIVYISHKMEEILAISDDITVFRDGKWIVTEPAENMTNAKIIRYMVGRELTSRFPPKVSEPHEVILDVQNLTGKFQPTIQDVTFNLRKGEILGIAGLVGAQRTELLEHMFGSATLESGKMVMHGKEITNHSPTEAIKNGFSFLTEERRATGIFPVLDIRANTVIASLDRYKKGPLLSDSMMGDRTKWVIDSMRVKTPSQRTLIKSLSGGNQQKVIIGRWMLTDPEVLLLDEPTRGVDVGAKYEIYQLIMDLAKRDKVFNQIYNDGKIPRLELVRFGQLCENEFIGVRSGIMDQFAIGMGKKDHAIHLNTDTLEYRYVRGVLPGHVFVIMNTAKRRELKDSKYNVRREECERALAQLQEKQAIRTLSEIKPQELDTLMPSVSDPVLQKRVRHVVTENVRVQEMMQAMETGDTEKMGRILNEGHASLRDDYEVTGPELDAITKRAREHPNCVGARMTGAGFGGCAIALVEKEAVDSFTSFVGEQYFKDTGLVAGFFVSELAGGTEEREERA